MAFKKGYIPWNKGMKYCDKIKRRLNLTGLKFGHQRGKKHHLWKGNKAGYSATHHWIYRQLGKAIQCSECGRVKNIDWANISGKYLRKTSDYKQLCRKCHAKFDDYVNKGWKTRRKHGL